MAPRAGLLPARWGAAARSFWVDAMGLVEVASPSHWPHAADRLLACGFEADWTKRHTFPGHQRLHTHDAHGNRVEVLAAG